MNVEDQDADETSIEAALNQATGVPPPPAEGECPTGMCAHKFQQQQADAAEEALNEAVGIVTGR